MINRRRFLAMFAAVLPIPAAADVVTVTTTESFSGIGGGPARRTYEIASLVGWPGCSIGWAIGGTVGGTISEMEGGGDETSKAQHSADEFDDLYVPALRP